MIKKKQSRTCIAAIKTSNGKIMMAADRRSSWDFSQAQKMPRAKIRSRDGLILAGTGDGALCYQIVDNLKFREYPYEEWGFEDEYLNNIFYNDVIKLLKSKGYVDVDAGLHPILKIPVESATEILICIHRRLYSLQIFNPHPEADYPNGLVTIDELGVPYATGCGGQLAWGSLLTTMDLGMKPKERLAIALNVAAQVSPGCDNNIDYIIGD